MTEPRAVTAPNGLTRWGAADGSTYSSKWEAEDANLRLEGMLPEPEVIETKEPSAVQRLIGLLVLGGATAFFGWMAIAGPIYAYEGKLDFKHEWMWLAAPFVWFVMAGMALQFGATLIASIRGGDVNDESVFDWWLNKVGCGLLTLVGWAIGIGLAYLVVSKLFDGVGKGTALIIILLAGILIVLAQNKSNRG